MKKKFCLLLLSALSCLARGQSFADLISRLNSLPQSQRQAVADSFMNSGNTFPFVEADTLVHFVYNSAAQSVALAGDATDWNPNKNLVNMNGCNLWYYSTSYEADARLDYKYVINGSDWILDPKNPYTCTGGYGPNSELRMPGYQSPPELVYYSAIPHGTFTDTLFHSDLLNNSRHVTIYLPPGYPSGAEAYPLILFHDGQDYISLCGIANILDYLTAQHLMVPVIGIFVPPVDRNEEYSGSKKDLFTGFIIDELMPVMDPRYKTSRVPPKRAMAGVSNSGNISLYIGMNHPGKFGKIIAQSSNVIPVISETFSAGPKLDLALYLDIGKYDIQVLIPMVHGLRDILEIKGYSFQFREWHEGHSWGNWKGHLRYPLLQFFPYSSGMNAAPDHDGMKLEQNRPNPFHGHTQIPFSAPVGSKVELTLADLSGRIIETIFSGPVSKSVNLIGYDHCEPAGQYIVTLKDGNRVWDSMLIQAF